MQSQKAENAESKVRRTENEAKREELIVERAVNTIIDEGGTRAALRTGGSPPMPPPSTNAENEPFFVFGESLVDEDGNGRPLSPAS